jgi:Flp pilus assembly protein TadD
MTTRTRLVGGAFLLLLLNSGWVWAFPAPNVFYVGNVLAHIGLGVLLLLTFWLAREPVIRQLRSGSWVAYGVLTLCGILGLVLAWIGATRPHMNVVIAHGAAGFLGALLLAWWAWRNAPRFGRATAAALAVALAFPAYAWMRDRYFPRADDQIVNPLMPPMSMYEEGPGKDSPFFPSSSDTNTGDYIPSGFFLESEACKECHTDIYNQWHSSAHHFSSFNNQFYRKSIELMQETAGIEASKWCAACHDHAMFFNGRFEKPVVGQIDTPEAHAGLGCMSCHSMVKVNDTMGNSGFVMEYPELHGLAMSDNPVIHTVQKYVTNIAPAAHRRAFLKPFMRTSEYCSACHKVHLDVPVNDYRWFRGFNEYDSWQASGVSGQGARSFYYPPASKECRDCHMPLTPSDDKGNYYGQVHSHRFPAANTALPHVNRDEEQLRTTEAFLKDDIVSVDIFAAAPADTLVDAPEMRRRAGDAQMATTFGVGEESAGGRGPVILRDVGHMAAPLDRVKPVFSPGDRVKVDVVVRTRSVGHFFPGGTVDSVDCWVELRGKDAKGRDVFWSGGVQRDGEGPVDPGAHFYRSVMLDEHGNLINKRNAFQTRSLLYARLIPPGAADVSHYLVEIPKWAEGPIRLEAKVHYRKFSHYYTQFSYAGKAESDDKTLYGKGFDDRPYSFKAANIPANVSGAIKDKIPALPITTLAAAETELALGEGKTDWKTATQEDDAVRWNDYGIGLLLQGDLKGAEYAFTRVTEAKPDWADGWLNVGRTLIEEGQTDTARPWVEKALELGPDLARVHYFYAQIFKSTGEYEDALLWLRRASETYPKDRVVLNDIGRILFLQKKYSEAVKILDRVARIDPEDLQMHYTRMLCYRGMGEMDLAAQEEQLFRRFKADESSQTRTAEPRRRSPEDNNERQTIHEHVSAPLPDASPALAGGTDD